MSLSLALSEFSPQIERVDAPLHIRLLMLLSSLLGTPRRVPYHLFESGEGAQQLPCDLGLDQVVFSGACQEDVQVAFVELFNELPLPRVVGVRHEVQAHAGHFARVDANFVEVVH